MRNDTIKVLLLAAAVVLAGPALVSAQDDSDGLLAEIQDVLVELKATGEEAREEAVANAEALLASAEGTVGSMRERAEEASDEAKEAFAATDAVLERTLADATERLEALRAASSDAYDDAKGELADTIEQLQIAVEQAAGGLADDEAERNTTGG